MTPILKFEDDFLIFNTQSTWMPINGPAYVISFPFHFTEEDSLAMANEIDAVLKKYYGDDEAGLRKTNKEFLHITS